MKFDLHIHSNRSYDSLSSIEAIIKYAKKRQLNGIAITDHNTIHHDIFDLSILDDVWIFPGTEVNTEIGDILALFVSAPLKSTTSISLIDEIHDQSGIAILSHPFKRMNSYPREILEKLDAVEIVNARWKNLNLLTSDPRVSQLLSIVKGRTAGSDAHFPFEVGRGYLKTPYLESRESLKTAIINGIGEATCQRFSYALDHLSQCIKFAKKPSVRAPRNLMYKLFKKRIERKIGDF